MGMHGKKSFQQEHKIASIQKPITLNSGGTATVDACQTSLAAIPGRILSFLMLGDVPGSSGLSVKLIGKKISDGSWEVIKDKAAADIVVASGKLADAGALEVSGLMASVDVEDLKGSSTYSDVGLRAANSAATNVVFAAMALWAGLFSLPSGQEDQFDAIVYA